MEIRLVGEGISGSLTPKMHLREGKALGLAIEYSLVDTLMADHKQQSLRDILMELEHQGVRGANITYPFKQQAHAFMNTRTADAATNV